MKIQNKVKTMKAKSLIDFVYIHFLTILISNLSQCASELTVKNSTSNYSPTQFFHPKSTSVYITPKDSSNSEHGYLPNFTRDEKIVEDSRKTVFRSDYKRFRLQETDRKNTRIKRTYGTFPHPTKINKELEFKHIMVFHKSGTVLCLSLKTDSLIGHDFCYYYYFLLCKVYSGYNAESMAPDVLC